MVCSTGEEYKRRPDYDINKPDGSTCAVGKILQGHKNDGGCGRYGSGDCLVITRRWFIKKVNAQFTDDKIKTQLQEENVTLKIISAERIITRDNKPAKAVVITTEGSEFPKTITCNKRQQEPESLLQECCSVPDARRFGTPMPTAAAKRLSAGSVAGTHSYSESPLAKADTGYKSPNVNRRCVIHGSRYLGCPTLYDSRDAIKLAIETNEPFKEARREYDVSTGLTKIDKVQIQKHIKELKSNFQDTIHKKRNMHKGGQG